MPRTAPRRAAAVLASAALLAPLALSSSWAGGTDPGSTSSDTLFPTSGNTGYDVRRYDVALDYTPGANQVEATITITARAQQALRSFHLDFEGPTLDTVTVGGKAATTSRDGAELIVTPASTIARGSTFTTVVTYAGTPPTHTDPDDSTEGWVPTSDGAVALGQPVGAATWLPSNNTPGDKADYRFRITVPAGWSAAANGALVSTTTSGTRTTWTWRTDEPMATYLATIAIGRFTVTKGSFRSRDGRTIPVTTFVDSQLGSADGLSRLTEILRTEEKWFGPYPFSAAGGIVDDANVGYALETQTRPFYPIGGADVSTVVHESAHQWFGDSVGLTDWHDIWLNEGFATYAEWLWDGAHGGKTPQQHFDDLYAEPAGSGLWSPAPRTFTDPADLFGEPVYNRGAMTLQALRVRIGSKDFFTLLRRWAAQHRDDTVRNAQFVALAEKVSGKELSAFFRTWLEIPKKPKGY
ncbi:M1 family metallopeptidase [Nocardioides fonticola]|uniref:Aminopeptidase N n=1 Tax=Nocardioides fonticola TaxID=450363 RepID=A0ABP7XQ68_9ACTN